MAMQSCKPSRFIKDQKLKTNRLIIAVTLLAFGQGAFATESGDVNYPSVVSVSTKSRTQVLDELNLAKARGQLPRLGEVSEPAVQFGLTKTRLEVCDELATHQRSVGSQHALTAY